MYNEIYENILHQLNEVDVNNPVLFNKIMRVGVPFDFSWISKGIDIDIKNFTMMNSKHGVFNTMLSALSVATGRHTALKYPYLSNPTKANTFTVLVGESAAGKDPLFDYVLNETIRKKDREIQEKYEVDKESWLNSNSSDKPLPQHLRRPPSIFVEDCTKEALVWQLRSNPILGIYTELDDFLKIYRNKQEDNMSMLIGIYSKHSYKVNRMGTDDGSRSADDTLLSMVIGAQENISKELFCEKYMSSGASYRFLFAFAEKKEFKKLTSGALDKQKELDSNRSKATHASNFKIIFDRVFNTYSKYSFEDTNLFNYDEEGLKIKNEVTSIFNLVSSAYFEEHEHTFKAKMIVKLHAYMCKFALLFQIMMDNDLENLKFGKELEDASVASVNRLVGKDAAILAFLYCLEMFGNWQDLAASTLQTNKTHEKEIKSMSVRKINIDYIRIYRLLFEGKQHVDVPKDYLDKLQRDGKIDKRAKSKLLNTTPVEEYNNTLIFGVNLLEMQKTGEFGTFDEEIKARLR